MGFKLRKIGMRPVKSLKQGDLFTVGKAVYILRHEYDPLVGGCPARRIYPSDGYEVNWSQTQEVTKVEILDIAVGPIL